MKIKNILFLLLSILVISCSRKQKEKEPKAPTQSANPTVITKPPAAELTVQTTDAFIAWASASNTEEKEMVRASIKKAANDNAVLQELINRYEKVDTQDITYSLVVLSLIGELQNPAALPWLVKQANRPIPSEENIPHAALSGGDVIEMISAKAVESLAYLKTKDADNEVRTIVAKHPSEAVRSAAIDAYLYNHNDSKEAKAELQRIAQPNDLMLLDRVRFKKTNDSKAFNAAQEEFYKQHPKELYEAPGKSVVKEIKKPDSIKVEQSITPPNFNIKH